ncbi:MAG: tagatose 1,6-diphosphate aldolase [Candidatus Omnitrophica bacterium]|nr:tagatose 1,6-diphosphate aldolase [Candidatus Omnitrophota bacterium]
MTISEGKLKSLEAVSDKNGVIRAAAMDQRGSLQKSIAKAKGVSDDQVTPAMLSEFKVAVTKVLTPHATAILLDPEFGLPAAKARSKNAGLLLAYEKTGYDDTSKGRIPTFIEGYSAKRIKEEGGDCVKVLLYYSPFDDPKVNQRKHEIMERIGRECEEADIAFFLEFVGYDPAGGDAKDLAYAKIKPDVVIKSMEEFSKDKYKVDVLKVEIPVDVKYLKGSKAFNGKEAAYDWAEAKAIFKRQDACAKKPFIYLSAGVSDEIFRESLELAISAGVNFAGVLCGRATWKDGIPVYAKEGVKALEAWLLDRGVKNIQALNQALEHGAKPWHAKYGGRQNVQVAASVR